MKTRSSPTQPLFELLEIDAADVDKHPAYLDEVLGKRATGIIIHGALSQDALAAAHKGITEASVPFYKRPFVGFEEGPSTPYMLGQVLVTSPPDLEDYFRTAGQTRANLRALFAGAVDLEERIAALLGPLVSNRPVTVPEGPGGRTYSPATIRTLPDGHGIGVHADNSSSRTPQMHDLATRAHVQHQLSYFFTLSAPIEGGELVVYGLEWDDVSKHFPDRFTPNEMLYDKTNSLLPLVELSGKETFRLREGDLIVFDAGRYYHRVTPTRGPKPRTTLGGFMALSVDGTKLHYWS